MGVEILAYPTNQFHNGEPDPIEKVVANLRNNMNIEFPIMDKIEINGPNTCEVYKYLRLNSELYDAKQKRAKEIPWNFAKFLVNANTGQVIKYFNPRVNPVNMVSDIEQCLAEM